MAVYSVTFHQRLDNYAVVQTLTEPELGLGQSFTLAGLGHGLNGTHTVYALPSYYFIGVDSQGDLLFDYNWPIPNQVLFYDADDDLSRTAAIPPGTLTFTESCTWITGTQIGTWLGIALAGVDETAFLTQCANSANNFIFRRRQESGYTDSLTSVPSADVELATIMMGGSIYRQRGAIDQFSSFSDMGNATVSGLSPLIKQLAGIPRPAVA
ncbi:hypothetical protein UFOVP800_4 [uncultured Caudovirales phage]|uniref:Gp6 domain containing protein n=1 Tax=uncultured Caudovirales phage TaxID=2100421 RepID=A0A6J5P1H6_9CAUD|nr:hypothetical protein UFOVP800_4 [uncultured Caudovirales phage]